MTQKWFCCKEPNFDVVLSVKEDIVSGLEQWARQVDFDIDGESVQTVINNGFMFSFFEYLREV